MTHSTDSDPRAYPKTPLVAVSASVFREDKVLLARRSRAPLDGIWSLPGGLVEPGEALSAAAAREVFEETGVRAEILGVADVVEVIQHDAAGAVARHYVIVSFAARWLSGNGETSPEAAEIAWRHPDDLSGLTLTDGTPAVVAKAADLLARG